MTGCFAAIRPPPIIAQSTVYPSADDIDSTELEHSTEERYGWTEAHPYLPKLMTRLSDSIAGNFTPRPTSHRQY